LKEEGKHQAVELEDLAAFIEGTLTPEERVRFLRTLDENDHALELLAETLQHANRPEEDASPDAYVRSAPPSDEPGWRAYRRQKEDAPFNALFRWIPAAAAILLGFVLLLTLQRERVTLPVAELLRPITREAPLRVTEADTRFWSAVRGTEDVTGFRLGVELVDLHLARRINDSVLRRSILSRIEALVENAGKGPGLADDLAAVEQGSGLGNFERRLENEFNPIHLAYGKWAESARIAAVNESADFFSSEPFRNFTREVRKLNMTGYVRGQIDRAETILGQEPSPESLRKLGPLFTSIVHLNGGL
jgi:hypothetical protein